MQAEETQSGICQPAEVALVRQRQSCLTERMMRLFWLVSLLLAASLAHGVELLGEPRIEPTETGATIRWKTDVQCGTRLNYGLSADKLDQKMDGGVTADHEVALTGLKAGTVYHYTLGSARQRLHAGSFTTQVKDASAASEPDAAASAPARKSYLDKMREIFAPPTKPQPKTPPASVQARAPPTRETWGRMDTLQDHYNRHGADFQSKDPDDYAAQAWRLLQRAKAGELRMKWDDTDDTLRVFDPITRAFAAYNKDGTTKTFFRPSNPAYWQRQPGRAIKPDELPF